MSMPNRWRSDITDVFKSNEICWMKQQNKDHRRGRGNSLQQKVGAKTATIKSCRTIYGETTSLVCEHSFTQAQKNEKYQVWETEKIRLNLMLKTGSDNVRYIPILNKIHECPWFFIFHFWFGKKHKWPPEIRNLQLSSRYVQNVYLCDWHWIYGEDLNKTKDIWTNKSAAMCRYSSLFVVHLWK